MKKEIRILSPFLLVILALCAIIYFFLGVGFDLNPIVGLVSVLAFGFILFMTSKKSGSLFTLVALTGIFLAISLGVSFGSTYTGDSPIALHIVLSPLMILLISFGGIGIVWFAHEKLKFKSKFNLLLLLIFVVLWVILSTNVVYFDDWKLENYLTVPSVFIIYFLHRRFRLSKVSYTLIFIFMTLHIFGTHYTYAEVPFGFWMQEVLGLNRNHYDRIVHFTFGLLLAYPMREALKRVADVKGVWSFYLPVDIVLALSGVYEIIEWLTAEIYGGDLGIAYLGSQGDVWDAQKDMLLAGSGAAIAMFITALIIVSFARKAFWHEFRESFKVKSKLVLGEEALARMKKKR